jgi:hypothetical protein
MTNKHNITHQKILQQYDSKIARACTCGPCSKSTRTSTFTLSFSSKTSTSEPHLTSTRQAQQPMTSYSRDASELVATLVCAISATITSTATMRRPDSGETNRYIPRVLLEPHPNAVTAAVILFALGMTIICILDKSIQQRRALILAVLGSCALGFALGDSARLIMMVRMPWLMLFAVVAYRMVYRRSAKPSRR